MSYRNKIFINFITVLSFSYVSSIAVLKFGRSRPVHKIYLGITTIQRDNSSQTLSRLSHPKSSSSYITVRRFLGTDRVLVSLNKIEMTNASPLVVTAKTGHLIDDRFWSIISKWEPTDRKYCLKSLNYVTWLTIKNVYKNVPASIVFGSETANIVLVYSFWNESYFGEHFTMILIVIRTRTG
jgi:hypothetical protein